ncbi:MAG TPA: alpha/beta hydrolase [Oculatellaceae cyanobacterium]
MAFKHSLLALLVATSVQIESAANTQESRVSLNCEASFRTYENLSYCTPNRVRCTGDLYVPEHTSLIPAVILIHGGGWISGDKSDEFPRLLVRKFLADGYAVFNINYRLVQDGGTFPYSIGDVQNALSYLASVAPSYGIDAKKIALAGESAGGYLALMVGFGADAELLKRAHSNDHGAKANCVVAFYPVTDLSQCEHGFVIDYMTDTEYHSPMLYKAAEPIKYARNAIPTLILHGERDMIVPLASSKNFVQQLQAGNHDSILFELSGAGHGFRTDAQIDASFNAVHRFLRAHLK